MPGATLWPLLASPWRLVATAYTSWTPLLQLGSTAQCKLSHVHAGLDHELIGTHLASSVRKIYRKFCILTWEIFSLISIGTSTSGSNARAAVTFSITLACSSAYSEKDVRKSLVEIIGRRTWTEGLRIWVELCTFFNNFHTFLRVVNVCWKRSVIFSPLEAWRFESERASQTYQEAAVVVLLPDGDVSNEW